MPVLPPQRPLDFTPLLRAVQQREGQEFRAQQLQTQHAFTAQRDKQQQQIANVNKLVDDAKEGFISPTAPPELLPMLQSLKQQKSALEDDSLNAQQRVNQQQQQVQNLGALAGGFLDENGKLVTNPRDVARAKEGLEALKLSVDDPKVAARLDTQFQNQAQLHRRNLRSEAAEERRDLTNQISAEARREVAKVRASASDPVEQAKRVADLERATRSNYLAARGFFPNSQGGGMSRIRYTTGPNGKQKIEYIGLTEAERKQVNEDVQRDVTDVFNTAKAVKLKPLTKESADWIEQALTLQLGKKPTNRQLADQAAMLGFGPARASSR